MESFRFLALAGTGGSHHDWCHNPQSPWMRMMNEAGGIPITYPDGEFLKWNGRVNGIFWRGHDDWDILKARVRGLLASYRREDRIIFAHSHGGQAPIKLAAEDFELWSLVTIATPRRKDVPAAAAVENVGYWQHLYDPEQDWIATTRRAIGGLGDGDWGTDRRILVPGATNLLNIAIPDVRHSRIFEAKHVNTFRECGIIERARLGATIGR